MQEYYQLRMMFLYEKDSKENNLKCEDNVVGF